MLVPRPAGFAAGIPDLASDINIAPPRPISALLNAPYTADAQRAKRQGAVEIEGIVRADGSVGLARVARSMDRLWGLDESALGAVRDLHFEPASLANRPVDVLTRFLVEFSLPNGKASGTIAVFLGYPLTREPPGLAKASDVTG
jgi:TonB family protein